ncbi:general substrate transporter [Apiospora phragmitis]|uniref:General substrate transporter n=1 Tax=Apiospora phragmitis TaxID=2905665 RepID=A0ABR1WV87_9PEZI
MATSAEAPLIAHRGDADGPDNDGPQHQDDSYADRSTQDGEPRGDGDRKIGLFMWLLAISAGISGLLFGYDTGVISATLVSLGTSLSGRELTLADKSIVTSCTSLLALVASPLSSVLADRIGRRPVILLADVLFAAGALGQAYAGTVGQMVFGRSVVGAAVGAASFVTPLYIAELAPAAHRGMLVTLNVLAITLGQVVAYVVGWAFAGHEQGWRYLVGLGTLPAVLQAALLLGMPETPRWLVRAGRVAAARRVIGKTLGGSGIGAAGAAAERVLQDIRREVREEEEEGGVLRGAKGVRAWTEGWRELVTVPKNRRALTIACLLQGLQQLCGFNSLMYFSATIFTLLGFSIPTLTSLSVAVSNFVFTVAALLLIDRIGRRRILLYSIPFMVLGLLLSAGGFWFIKLPNDGLGGIPESGESAAAAAVTILTSMIVFVAAYALGLGNVPWMQSELFPLGVRALGSGLSTATNWSANFVVGLTFLPLMDALTPTWTFVLYAAVCVGGWGAVWRIYPETTGLSLEEATGLLENDWGVGRGGSSRARAGGR